MTMKGSTDKDEPDETWQEFYEENRIIPPQRIRRNSSKNLNSFPFCLTLKSIDGISVPSSAVSNALCVFVSSFTCNANYFAKKLIWLEGPLTFHLDKPVVD